ncbi:MAG: DUF3137 domain-containing protein [Acholeplasmatales bacterium]|nr:DUF3137 domain-containing protein [Acholeplasmatales bacterium]
MVYNDIENIRLKYVDKYNKRIKLGKIYTIIGIIGLILVTIISLVTLFFDITYRFGIFMIVFSIPLFAGMVMPFTSSKIKKEYSKEVKVKIIEKMMNKYYDNVTYVREEDQTKTIENSRLFSGVIPKACAEDVISGSYNGIYFKMFDVEVKRNFTSNTNSSSVTRRLINNKTNVEDMYELLFKGQWFSFKLNRKLDTSICIKEMIFIDEAIKNTLNEVKVESIEFSKKYRAYASNSQHFFYIFTPSMIEKFIQLDRICDGQIMFSLNNNIVNIGINNGVDSFELDLFKTVNDENLKKLEQQISLAAAIIHDFRFDSYKFDKDQNPLTVNRF